MTSTATHRRDELFVFDADGDLPPDHEASTEHVSLPYYPALDGLRGVAVAAVVLYHGGFSVGGELMARGGYLGVDAFFVLSGFLITGLLLAEWRSTGGLALGAFWIRRARRLLPALFLCLLLVSAYVALAVAPEAKSGLRAEMLASEFYVANWWFIFSDTGYFNQFFLSPVRHLWSLGIEEQFYLIWPPVVLLVLRRWTSARAVLWTAVLMAIGSMLAMALLFDSGAGVDRVYFGTDTRLQSMGIGAALAAAVHQGLAVRGRRAGLLLTALSLVASGLLAVAWMRTPGSASWLYTGGLLCLAVLVALVIFTVTQESGAPNPVKAALSIRPLRWLGVISYGVYLYHWPIMLWLDGNRTGLSGNALLALQTAVTLALAMASYRWVERPIRQGEVLGRVGFRWWWLVVPFAVVTVAILWSTRDATNTLAFEAEKSPQGREVPVVEGAADTPLTERPAKVLLLGDSVTYGLGVGFEVADQEVTDQVAVYNQAVLYCELLEGRRRELSGLEEKASQTCRNWQADWGQARDFFAPDVVVLGVGPWELFDRQIDGEWVVFGTPEFDARFVAQLQEMTDFLTLDGTPVALMTSPSLTRGPGGDTSAEWTEAERWRVEHLNGLFAQVAAANPGRVTLLELGDYVCPDGACINELSGSVVRSDGVHYTPNQPSTDAVVAWLAPRMRHAALWGAGVEGQPQP